MKKPSPETLSKLARLADQAREGEADWFLAILRRAGLLGGDAGLEGLKAKQVAELFGVTAQAVGLWVRNQGAPRNQDGTFDLREVIRWRCANLEAEARSVDSPAMERKRAAEAEMAEIKLAEIKGNLIPKAEVIKGWLARIAATKSGLEILSKKLPPLLAGKSTREISTTIASAVREILEEFSR